MSAKGLQWRLKPLQAFCLQKICTFNTKVKKYSIKIKEEVRRLVAILILKGGVRIVKSDIGPKAIALALVGNINDDNLLWLIVSFVQGLIENDN